MLPPIPPTVCRHCRIGNHKGCAGFDCSCANPAHYPDDLINIDDGDGFLDHVDPAADLEQAKACLYCLEERACRALAAGSRSEVRALLREIRDVARTCLGAIDQD